MMRRSLQEYMEMYGQEHTKPMTRATHFFGIPLIVASLPMALVKPKLAAQMFVGGWVLQFLGHRIEGNRPAFTGDPFYLLVGPLWVAREMAQIACGRWTCAATPGASPANPGA